MDRNRHALFVLAALTLTSSVAIAQPEVPYATGPSVGYAVCEYAILRECDGVTTWVFYDRGRFLAWTDDACNGDSRLSAGTWTRDDRSGDVEVRRQWSLVPEQRHRTYEADDVSPDLMAWERVDYGVGVLVGAHFAGQWNGRRTDHEYTRCIGAWEAYPRGVPGGYPRELPRAAAALLATPAEAPDRPLWMQASDPPHADVAVEPTSADEASAAVEPPPVALPVPEAAEVAQGFGRVRGVGPIDEEPEANTQRAPPVEPQPLIAPGEVWSGSYRCSQGWTPGQIAILSVEGDTARATFTFGDGRPRVSGTYELIGRWSDAGAIVWTTGAWIQRPPGYITVGFEGDVRGDSMSGTVTHSSCGAFTFAREP